MPTSPVTEGLNPIFKVGQFFGLLPIKFKNSSTNFHRFQKLYTIYTLCANFSILIFAIILFFRDLASANANLIEQLLDMVYHCHILINIATCIYQARNVPSVLSTWDEVEVLLEAYENEEPHDQILFRKFLLPIFPVSTVRGINTFPEYPIQVVQSDGKRLHKRFIKIARMVTSSYVLIIFVGAVSYFIAISINEETNLLSGYLYEVSAIYVIEEWIFWWTGFYILFIGHTMELIWAFGDMLILSVGLVLWYQFKRFNKIMTRCCATNLQPRDLEDLRMVHWAISKATKKTNKMLSVLTTTVFICNILYLFSRVFNGIEDDLKHPNWFINFEAVYAFSYLIIRIFATAIVATKFASESVASFTILARSEFYGRSEIEFLLTDRFCIQLMTANVAISGCGYFYVDRGFIATLISALITYEVVILQFSIASKSKESMFNNGTFMQNIQ